MSPEAGPAGGTELCPVRVGFLPLLDAGIVIAASELGFAAAEGISLHLCKETSWANIRDRLAVGHFDAAHILAPLPISTALGLSPLAAKLIAPVALGLGGNAVTVSSAVWRGLARLGAPSDGDPRAVGDALRALVAERKAAGQRPLLFAVVHAFSAHNFELRYWLDACGIEAGRDIEITITPPPFMADALAAGRIDGYCVGEPWNSVAVLAGAGRIVTTKSAIWRASPEKVLACRDEWASAHPQALRALVRALVAAAQWCDGRENHARLAQILSRAEYLDLPADRIMPGLANELQLGDAPAAPIGDFHVFGRGGATRPRVSHALWFYAQMVRWGYAPLSEAAAGSAAAVYAPQVYAEALGQEPPEDGPVEGFFDGRAFDPATFRGRAAPSGMMPEG